MKHQQLSWILGGALSLGLLGVALAQDHDSNQSKTPQEHKVYRPEDVRWAPGPPALPPGGQMAILSGDPTKPGPFTLRFKVPDGYKIPAHYHPADENVTVISGTFYMGMGDKLDPQQGHKVPAGSFAMMPAGMHHFAWSEGESVVQVHGLGPWGITYINPADDPRQKLTPTGRTQD